LSADELRRLDEHAAICHRCLEIYRYEDGFLDQVRDKLGRVQAPSSLRESILARVREGSQD